MYNSFAIVLNHVIYFIFGFSLWARPRVPNTKYHLKMAVGVSWSSAGLATGNQTQSPVGLIGLVHKTKQEGLHPLGRALAGLGQASWASRPRQRFETRPNTRRQQCCDSGPIISIHSLRALRRLCLAV
jgi:hypothetical protein